jgi:hypothetical protein
MEVNIKQCISKAKSYLFKLRADNRLRWLVCGPAVAQCHSVGFLDWPCPPLAPPGGLFRNHLDSHSAISLSKGFRIGKRTSWIVCTLHLVLSSCPSSRSSIICDWKKSTSLFGLLFIGTWVFPVQCSFLQWFRDQHLLPSNRDSKWHICITGRSCGLLFHLLQFRVRKFNDNATVFLSKLRCLHGLFEWSFSGHFRQMEMCSHPREW